MKWPERLTLVRHAESEFNRMKMRKEEDPLYQKFKVAYDINPGSDDCREIALEIVDQFPVKVGDHDTPLAHDDEEKARIVGERLKDKIPTPNVIFVSPYERTYETLRRITQGWQELLDVKIVEEERLREQEHGLALLYWDWRVFNVLHEEQRRLRKIEGGYWYRYPQGESVPDVKERIRSWQGTLTREYSEEGVLSITHHLAILSVRANLERWSAKQFLNFDYRDKPINLGVTMYKGDPVQGDDGRLILEAYNLKLY